MIDYESKIFDYKTIRALEYGSFKVAHEDFLLSDWTSELYDYFLQRARSQNFQFKSEFGEILDNSVVGDAASLKRVMMALFELSAVVIPQNRVVTFRVEQLSDFAADYTFLRLVLRASGDTVRKDAVDALVIASPITAGEDAAHLLELAKKMLGIMHGSLTVQVREKQDITFTVAIPLYRHAYVNDTTKKINKLDTPECYDLSKLRVLVGVENQVEREIMVAVFERFHIKTDTAVFILMAFIVFKYVEDKKVADIYTDGCLIYNPKDSSMGYFVKYDDIKEWEVTHDNGHDSIIFTFNDGNRTFFDTFQANKAYDALNSVIHDKEKRVVQAKKNKEMHFEIRNPLDWFKKKKQQQNQKTKQKNIKK